MDKFLGDIGNALNALNTSDLWGYIKSIIAKLEALFEELGETEVLGIFKKIFPEAE